MKGLERLKGKNIVLVYKENNKDQNLIGKLLDTSSNFLVVLSRGRHFYINFNSIIKIKEWAGKGWK